MNAAPRSSAKLYLTNATSTVATRLLQLGVLVWVNQYLLRRIEASEYSLLPLVTSLIVFAEVVRNIFTSGLARYLVEADSRGDGTEVSRMVSSMLPVLLAVAACFAVAGAVSIWHIEGLLNVEPRYVADARLMMALLVATLCITVATAPWADGLAIRQRFTTLNVVELACEALRMALLFVLLISVSARVLWLVVASTAATLTSLTLRIAITRQIIPSIRFSKRLYSFATARRLMSFGAWTSIEGFATLVANAAPALLLNRFGSAIDVACFHLGRLPDTQIRRIGMAAASPAQPALISLYANEGKDALNHLYFRGGRYHLLLTLMGVAPLLAFGAPIVDLYVGREYAATPAVMIGILGSYPFIWGSAMYFRVSHAIGKVRGYYMTYVVLQVGILGALYFAVAERHLGAAGAGAAIGISSVVLHVLLIWPMGLRLVNGRWSSFLLQTLLPGILPFAAALVAGLAIGFSIDMTSWLHVALGSAVTLVVYVTVMLCFSLDSYDRSVLARVVKRVRDVFTRNSPMVRSQAPETQ